MRISMLRSSSSDRWANCGGRRTQVLPAVTESLRRCLSEKMPPSQCLYLHTAVFMPMQHQHHVCKPQDTGKPMCCQQYPRLQKMSHGHKIVRLL